MMSKVLVVLLLATALTGCGGFFIGLGLLIECGPFPMSIDSCGPKRAPVIPPNPPENVDTSPF